MKLQKVMLFIFAEVCAILNLPTRIIKKLIQLFWYRLEKIEIIKQSQEETDIENEELSDVEIFSIELFNS